MRFDRKWLKNTIQYFAVLMIRFCTNILNVFPIKKNRILFYSFNGKSFSCNPRVIYEYIYQKRTNAYEIIWSLKKPDDYATNLPLDVKRVKFRSLKHYYYMKTSAVVIYNVHEEGEIARRKGQIYIQTWHASNGYKNLKTPDSVWDKTVDRLHHKNYSYVCSGCESMTRRRIRGSLQFKGEVICGTPRMDQLFHHEQKMFHVELCEHFGIPYDAKLLLYAPTWQGNRNEINYGLEYGVLRESLRNRFGGNWYILVRFHPNVKAANVQFTENYIVNVTEYPEMQKLICGSDAMISDYSSCVWDFSFTYRPCFLFLPNFEEIGGNDAFEIPIEKWGYPFSYSMEELQAIIRDFDETDFRKSMDNHHREMGCFEDGHATERVIALIETFTQN